MRYRDIQDRLAPAGLIARGGFRDEDGRSVVLVGNAGPAMWAAFSRSPEYADGAPHGLDRWTARVVHAIAEALGAEPVFPFEGPPYHPFLAWSQKAEGLGQSPLGMLIHPDYGLWYAYRAALRIPARIDLPAPDPRSRPCDTCVGKPCLTACPVEAFQDGGTIPAAYDVAACKSHVGSPAGTDCLTGGCLARRACPVGRDYAYAPAQARFHMDAFVGNAPRAEKDG